jgi:hypothetical protein
MAVGAKLLIPRCMGARFLVPGALSLIFCLGIGICQDQPRNNNAALKYDLQAETKIKGVEEVNLFDVGTRKDYVELVVKSGEGKVVVYVWAKAFRYELGITFSKAADITIIGAQAKREESEVVLTSGLVRGQETFPFS